MRNDTVVQRHVTRSAAVLDPLAGAAGRKHSLQCALLTKLVPVASERRFDLLPGDLVANATGHQLGILMHFSGFAKHERRLALC